MNENISLTLRQLKDQFEGQSSFPTEEGITWSYENIHFLEGKLASYYELDLIPYSFKIISSTLYRYTHMVDEKILSSIPCYRWLKKNEVI